MSPVLHKPSGPSKSRERKWKASLTLGRCRSRHRRPPSHRAHLKQQGKYLAAGQLGELCARTGCVESGQDNEPRKSAEQGRSDLKITPIFQLSVLLTTRHAPVQWSCKSSQVESLVRKKRITRPNLIKVRRVVEAVTQQVQKAA